jgi:hypothetical protein
VRSAGDFWGGFSRHYRPVIQNKKLCSTVGMADRRYTPENIARCREAQGEHKKYY